MLKRVLFRVLLASALCLAAGCQPRPGGEIGDRPPSGDDRSSGGLPEHRVYHEDHVTDTFVFPDGTYYSYLWEVEGDSCRSPFGLEDLLADLFRSGIEVREVWYKARARACYPPGSTIGMQVLVEPVLIVRLDEADDRMGRNCFVPSGVAGFPGMGTCAYRVEHFVFQRADGARR